MEINHCMFPDDLIYDSDANVWVKLDSEMATIGITCIYSFLCGKIETVKFKPLGILEAGKSVATIESPKFFGAVRTPIAGELVEVNGELLKNPKLANKSPYSAGWFAKMKIAENRRTNGLNEVLFSVGQLETKLQSSIEELRIRCFSVYPDYEISGIGGECPETLEQLDQLMQKVGSDESIHLVTDNPVAESDVPKWVSIRGYNILETRIEGSSLFHFMIGR